MRRGFERVYTYAAYYSTPRGFNHHSQLNSSGFVFYSIQTLARYGVHAYGLAWYDMKCYEMVAYSRLLFPEHWTEVPVPE